MGPSEQGCWRHSEVHGLGGIGSVCPEGQEQNGAMCYPGCKDGYGGAGPECWQRCPEGFRDDGAYCAKPGAYGRGVGYFREQKCTDQNSQGCEKWGLLWYPKCKGGFHAVGCCVCSPDCPSGMQDIGIACWKQTYGRGLGSFAQCAAGEEGIQRAEMGIRGGVHVGDVDAVGAVTDDTQFASTGAFQDARKEMMIARSPD